MLFFGGVSSKDKALLTRQLATMLNAGLAVDQIFKILLSQTKNKELAFAYQNIIYDLEQGNALSFSLARQKKIFDPVFIAIVRSGEDTGKLDKVLDKLADRMEMSEDFNNKIKGALYYPGFVLATMIIILFLMMFYIIPQLKTVFENIGTELPFATKMVLKMSDITVKYWWAMILGIIGLAVGFYFFIHSKAGSNRWDRIKIGTPVVKDLYVLIYMTRFCQTMAVLVQSGIPIMETVAISADVIQNQVYTESLRNVISQIERGIPMSVPLSKDKHFPIMVSQMVLVGEQTGKMAPILEKLSEYYEKETDNKIKNMSGLIEPILIVIIGIGVAFMVFSVIWPIYSIAQTGL